MTVDEKIVEEKQIQDMMDELGILEARVSRMRIQLEEARTHSIPMADQMNLGILDERIARLQEEKQAILQSQSVQDALARVEKTVGAEVSLMEETVIQLRARVIEHVTLFGASIKSLMYRAQYRKGSTTWNTEGLNGYAVAHPEILAFRKPPGKPSVTLTRIEEE